MSMGIEIAVASATAIAGLASLFKSIMGARGNKKRNYSIKIDLENGNHIEIPAETSANDIHILINKLSQIDTKDLKSSINGLKKDNIVNNEDGFVKSEFLMYFVPGIIAIAFAGTFIYLILANQGVANYSIPKELSSSMATILGYFFGVGVTNAANQGQQLSLDDIQKLING